MSDLFAADSMPLEPPADMAGALSVDESDALGEIGNICMGTAATTLSTLLGKEVSITTPRVSVCESARDFVDYKKPFLVVEVSYTQGVDGYNILLIKDDDVRVITDLLLGGEGSPNMEEPIDQLHFSAISEVMNQMVGSSSTSLADILMKPINISPPVVKQITLGEDSFSQLACGEDTTIKISFAMEIEGVLKSQIMQIMPFDFGKQLAHTLLGSVMTEPVPAPARPGPAFAPTPVPAAAPRHTPPPQRQSEYAQPDRGGDRNRVGVKSMQYQSFDEPSRSSRDSYFDGESGDNIGLIMDVPLQVTVELGKCRKSIKEILGFNLGSVVVLDRLAGEMVDVLVNGKLFARGEVVVIDDNYGVRITEIVSAP
ncbi:MAG: flagellar motor switch phosphatase FliY [Clostridiaceae bacterium]|nr:flagellar motor switch phosphatase FliY [Eubacteriales bacterium]